MSVFTNSKYCIDSSDRCEWKFTITNMHKFSEFIIECRKCTYIICSHFLHLILPFDCSAYIIIMML